MKYILSFVLVFALCLFGCGRKKNPANENAQFFPALSFLQSQVKDVDTSVYPLLKIVTVDSVSDTTYIKRDDFKTYAGDFLSIPDISSKDLKDQYTETRMYDETIGRAVLDYTAKNNSAEISREEILIEPDVQAGDKLKSIIIDRLIDNKDSTVQKRMFWQVNKRFQIVTIVQKPNEPNKVKTVEVVWNDFHPAE